MTDSITRPLKVFLCHASADKSAVRKLYRYLRSKGMDPWLDEVKLIPGQQWQVEIPKALYSSDAIIVVLSNNSITKEGYVQREIKFALDKALDMPEGRIFLIPARLEECELPESLKGYQWVDLFQKNWNRRLMSSLNERIAQLGLTPLSPMGDAQPPVTNTPVTSRANHARFNSPEAEKTFIEEKPKVKEQISEETSVEQNDVLSIQVVGHDDLYSSRQEPLPASIEISKEKSEEEKIIEKQLVIPSRSESQSENILSRKLPEKRRIISNPKLRLLIGVASVLIIVPVCIMVGVNYSINNLFGFVTVTLTPSPTNTVSTALTSQPTTDTPSPTNTVSAMLISQPTTNTPSPMRTLDIGSIMIGKDGMPLLYVPAGKFTMGSDDGKSDEKPAHKVDLNAFWIDKTEVTFEMYNLCIESGDCEKPAVSYAYYSGDLPIYGVTWKDANVYCTWVERRLPTEAEWEKAARGTDQRIYPWGNNEPNRNLLNMSPWGSATVGSYPDGASFFGALDMAGNLWEWVNDWYDSNYYSNSPPSDPPGPDSGTSKVIRGGSWDFAADTRTIRTTARVRQNPSTPWVKLGFRCAMSDDQQAGSTPLAQASTDTPPPTQTSALPVPTLGIGSTTGKDGMTLLYVPAGEFTMGSETGSDDEKPVHPVYLDAFYIDKTEVTNKMYAVCVEAGVCDEPTNTSSFTHSRYYGNSEFDSYPVIYVDWNMAKTYCEWADRRLPTETEWEKAASWDEVKQQKYIYPWGAAIDCSLTNYYDKTNGCIGDTTQVAKYPNGASPYGALDMAGNVFEWVVDWYDAYPGNTVSNSNYGTKYRVLRGGSWDYLDGALVRSANRLWVDPMGSYNFAGFRCARSP